MVSARELAFSRGAGGGPIYLAVLGQVFDVSRGRKHYGAPTAMPGHHQNLAQQGLRFKVVIKSRLACGHRPAPLPSRAARSAGQRMPAVPAAALLRCCLWCLTGLISSF